MVKKRTGDPWVPAPEFGPSLTGLMINLLVADIDRQRLFQVQVLGAREVYADPDIAVFQACGAQWMLHADHTYDQHASRPRFDGLSVRGRGAEFRLHGRDPDVAVRAAEKLGCGILSAPKDMPAHGLREAFILDPDGYLWVPDIPIPG